MLRNRLFLVSITLLFSLGLAGCLSLPTPPPETVVAEEPVTSTPPAAATPSPTIPPTPLPTPTTTPTPDEPAAPTLTLAPEDVFIYPGPERYAGDLITFQIMPQLPPDLPPGEVEVQILINEEIIVDSALNWFNLGGDPGGLYTWVWDTSHQAGVHDLTIVLDPRYTILDPDEENRLDLSIAIQPADALPAREAQAAWITVRNNCCYVHVIGQSAAHRDLEYLADMVDDAFATASQVLAEIPIRRYHVYFVDRVIGQGGFAGASMVVSYLDRDYAGGDLFTLLTHEAIHLIDRQFAPNRISFMAEGVAVWGAGGHYKPEALERRAAALLETQQIIPLETLSDNFYRTQHEIGYLQAASFISYLVDSYGWDRTRAFYADVTPLSGETPALALEANLQTHFDLSLAEAEAGWLRYLAGQPRDRQAIPDLRATIRFYEAMRRYQAAYDPGAYFLTAWLPWPEEAQERGVTADFSRRPRAEINVVLETMLHAANQSLMAGDYDRAHGLLDSVTRVIDSNGAFIDPLANHYRAIVRATAMMGYEAQQIYINQDQATVWANTPEKVELVRFNLALNEQNWGVIR